MANGSCRRSKCEQSKKAKKTSRQSTDTTLTIATNLRCNCTISLVNTPFLTENFDAKKNYTTKKIKSNNAIANAMSIARSVMPKMKCATFQN